MKKRFIFTLVVGIIICISVLLFGTAGHISLTLMILIVLFKKKYDEREYYLYYKTNNFAFLITILTMAYFQKMSVAGNALMQGSYLIMTISAFFIVQGIIGIVIFNRE